MVYLDYEYSFESDCNLQVVGLSGHIIFLCMFVQKVKRTCGARHLYYSLLYYDRQGPSFQVLAFTISTIATL